MPLLSIPNEMPAAGTNGDGLNFVWTTTAPSHEKDSTDDLYHTPHTRRKP